MSGLRLLHVQTGCPPPSFPPRQALDGHDLPDDCKVLRVRGELSESVLQKNTVQVAFVEHVADRKASIRAVRLLRAHSPELPIILLAWESSEDFAIDALNTGVSRYLKLPAQLNQIPTVLGEIIPEFDANGSSSFHGGPPLVGTSASIRELRRYIRQIGPCDSNVLITGETGTGKELVAEQIKDNSKRRDRPFVCLNSAAIPDALVESELFGYEKGAFTGAFTPQEGKLAAANHGTVFFDEIGDVSPSVQAKLLRAIESRKIYRLGSNRSCDLDVRILAASNQDLEVATQENRFRSDLYYRLNVIRIEVPPLREHVEDLPVLVDHYLKRFGDKFSKQVSSLNTEAMDLLFAYPWPGNIRELRNVMEATFANLPERCQLDKVDLPVQVTRHLLRDCKVQVSNSMHEFTERTAILRALNAAQWNRTDAAKRLHWSRMTLYRKMVRYQFDRTGK